VRNHEARVTVRICDLARQKCVEREALVDTGSTLSSITEEVRAELGLPVIASYPADPALTNPQLVDAADAILDFEGQAVPTRVIIARKFLIGLLDLEARGLVVDTRTGEVKKVPILV